MPFPPKNPTLTKIATVRFSPAEYEALKVLADDRHITFSDLVRRIACDHELPPQRLPKVDAEAVRELARIGVNVNQLTHLFHQFANIASTDRPELNTFWKEGAGHLQELSHKIDELRAELLR
jgi:hypothetical protein